MTSTYINLNALAHELTFGPDWRTKLEKEYPRYDCYAPPPPGQRQVAMLAIDRLPIALRRMLDNMFVWMGLADDTRQAASYTDGPAIALRAMGQKVSMSRRVHWLVRKTLLPVEAATRRLIIMIAATLPQPVVTFREPVQGVAEQDAARPELAQTPGGSGQEPDPPRVQGSEPDAERSAEPATPVAGESGDAADSAPPEQPAEKSKSKNTPTPNPSPQGGGEPGGNVGVSPSPLRGSAERAEGPGKVGGGGTNSLAAPGQSADRAEGPGKISSGGTIFLSSIPAPAGWVENLRKAKVDGEIAPTIPTRPPRFQLIESQGDIFDRPPSWAREDAKPRPKPTFTRRDGLEGPVPKPVSPWHAPNAGDPVPDEHLMRRVTALAFALADLPGQARRWLRVRAICLARVKLFLPLRIGRPPGSPPKSLPDVKRLEEHDVLDEAHYRARIAQRKIEETDYKAHIARQKIDSS